MKPAPAITLAADFAGIAIGDEARLTKKISAADVAAFASLSGDDNPLHVSTEFARRTSFQRPVAHGMLVASYVSTLIGTQLPGPGALWAQQSFRWRAPVFIDDEISFTLRVTHKSASTRTLNIAINAVNQHGHTVLEGEGTVMMLEERQPIRSLPLAARVALITGAGRGIGAAIAQALAAAGARVIINFIKDEAAAIELQRTIASNGGQALAWQADVTQLAEVQEMIDRAAQHFGQPVDVLINNAGAAIQARPFNETAWDEMQRHFDVQIRGAFNCAQAALPAMLAAQSARIINIGSVYAWNTPPPNLIGYVTAKAALAAFTRALAVELSPKGVRVNLVSPGMTETDLIAAVPERLRKVQAMQTPLRRLATPSDIASTVVFLCSEAADFITGADIPVCGGAVM
jgi:3-oxoacyl-[acyl-carrier protein] reductase